MFRIACVHAIAALGLACAATPAAADTAALVERLRDTSATAPVMVIAHRACWKAAPENSLEAIEACVRAGIDMIEIDVRATRDGALVLMHDVTVDRTTDGRGRIADMTAAEVAALHLREAAGGEGAAPTGHRVPTLEEALRAARGRILVNLDMKVAEEQRVADLVERLGMNEQVLMKLGGPPDSQRLATAPFMGKSFFMPIVGQCDRKAKPQCTDQPRIPLAAWTRYQPIAYELVFDDLEWFRAAAAQARALDTRIWVNTLNPSLAAGIGDEAALANPDDSWGRLVDMGATMIQTDEPEALAAWLRQRD